MARRAFETGQTTANELKERIESVRIILAEATRILSLEDPASPEGAMGTAAVQALDQIQRWISSLWSDCSARVSIWNRKPTSKKISQVSSCLVFFLIKYNKIKGAFIKIFCSSNRTEKVQHVYISLKKTDKNLYTLTRAQEN